MLVVTTSIQESQNQDKENMEDKTKTILVRQKSDADKAKLKPVINMLLKYRAKHPDQGILEANQEDIVR